MDKKETQERTRIKRAILRLIRKNRQKHDLLAMTIFIRGNVNLIREVIRIMLVCGDIIYAENGRFDIPC